MSVGGQCSGTNMASGTITSPSPTLTETLSSLTLVSNSNPTLVPNSEIVIGGTGNSRTLTVTAAAKKSGTATLTLSLSDGTDDRPIVVTVMVGTDKNETLNGTAAPT